jgi:protein gp37
MASIVKDEPRPRVQALRIAAPNRAAQCYFGRHGNNQEPVMAETSIEWTDATWNPVAGCNVLTAGCTNCYAMRMAARLEAMGQEKYVGLTRKSGGRSVWTGKVHLDQKALAIPASWSKPRKVFVNSMSDLFHNKVPGEFIRHVWQVMEETPRHTYQILTKRPDRMLAVLSSGFPVLPNVWLGTSVEDGRVLDRLEPLRKVPTAIRFVSFEPLIGSVRCADLSNIHWAIVGGESGPRSREMKREWVIEIERLCRAFGTAFFFKQWGGTNKKATGRELRGRTYDEMPRVQSVL